MLRRESGVASNDASVRHTWTAAAGSKHGEQLSHIRHRGVHHASHLPRYGRCMTRAAKVATPWGPAILVEEVALPQSAGDKEFAAIVQLLEIASGERLLRFAYSTGDTAR